MRTTGAMRALLLMLVLAAPVLTAPATALGQSAGDEQYVDPFQGDGNGSQGGQGDSGSQPGSGTDDQNGSGAPPQEAPEQPAAAAPAPDPGVAVETVSPDGSALPRSGLPLAGLVVTGVLLLAGGLTLRRRV